MEIKYNHNNLSIDIIDIPRRAYSKIKATIFMYKLSIRKAKVKWEGKEQVSLILPNEETFNEVYSGRDKIDEAFKQLLYR